MEASRSIVVSPGSQRLGMMISIIMHGMATGKSAV